MKHIKRIQPTQDSTLAQQCYDQLQDYIIDGVFSPGYKLRVEELKEQLGIGQSPIREALSRLVASGLVETEENKGFRVARMSEADVRDTYKTYLAIELLALEKAIALGDDAWQATIVATLYQLALIENKGEPVPYRLWAERNYAFHVALITGCNSPLLLQIRAEVYKRFDRYCRVAFNLAGRVAFKSRRA